MTVRELISFCPFKILLSQMRLPQDGPECSRRNLFPIRGNDNDKHHRFPEFPEFGMTAPLGNINKALALEDFHDLGR